MDVSMKLLVLAQTGFWGRTGWKIFVRAREVTSETAPPRPLSYVAGHWLLVTLSATFAVGSILTLLGFG